MLMLFVRIKPLTLPISKGKESHRSENPLAILEAIGHRAAEGGIAGSPAGSWLVPTTKAKGVWQ